MFFYIGMATGSIMIIGSAYKMFKILNESVVIKKRDFIDIEKRIRLDERNKIQEENELKEENIIWLSQKK